MNAPAKRYWYPAFVIYRWRHVLWVVPMLALSGLLALHWKHLRWDHAMAVVHLRPTGVLTISVPAPGFSAHPAGESLLKISPEVLRKTVSDTGLAMAWQTTGEQAAERLRALVMCEAVPRTATIEVKVRKLPSADTLKVCETVIKHANEEVVAERLARDLEELDRWRSEAEMVQAELETIRAELSDWLRGNPLSPEDVRELKDEFESKQRLLEQLKLRIISDEMDLRISESPSITLVRPYWPGKPAARHLKQFGISAAWTFGVSVLVAIALAYLLEALIPRKKAQAVLAP